MATRSEAGTPGAWAPDRELDSFSTLTLELPDLPIVAGEREGSLCATLIRRAAPQPTRRSAMLYIHGWNDYFFQEHFARHAEEVGYDFYAIDLHRYGRSLRAGNLAGYCTDLGDYFPELEWAADVIRQEGHDELVVTGHSTGGLIALLWLQAHPGVAKALVLNSPWIELQGYPALRSAIRPMLTAARQVSATAVLPIGDGDFYQRCISAAKEGVWDYNPNFKGDEAFNVRVGWLAAVMAGHAKVSEGLDIGVPIFMAISARSDFGRKWSEDMRRMDLVLDVARLAARAHCLGRHVTLVRIEGGMHDLSLSDEPARGEYFTKVSRWLKAYG